MKLCELLKGIQTKNQFKDIEISNITTNSLEVKKGFLFVAIEGVNVDGHSFIEEAKKNGAVAVLAQKDTGVDIPHILTANTRNALSVLWGNFYHNPAKALRLIGVTGTNGKTTTTYLTHHILSENNIKAGLIGTVENIIGEVKEPSKYTTPEPSALQELLSKMREQDVRDVVMEVSSHSLSQDRVAGLFFEVGAFTNLTRDHLDYHKTMEGYLAEKLKLMDRCNKAVINVDDEYGTEFIKRAKGKVITYGIEKQADFRATNIKHSPNGSDFTLVYPEGKINAFIGIPGQFSVYNALCSLAISDCLGIDMQKAVEALKKASGVNGRMEIVKTNENFSIIIDYAHTPDGLLNAVKTLKEIPKEGKLIVLFGCGGDRDKTKRPMMGKIAGELADFVIVTSDNPRTENPHSIINDILKGMKNIKIPFEVIADRKDAIHFAIENAKQGDVILLAGKGHETYQILKDKTIHFDEREVIAEILHSH